MSEAFSSEQIRAMAQALEQCLSQLRTRQPFDGELSAAEKAFTRAILDAVGRGVSDVTALVECALASHAATARNDNSL